jgi:two-component system chemotaxis sensor kinase CheA
VLELLKQTVDQLRMAVTDPEFVGSDISGKYLLDLKSRWSGIETNPRRAEVKQSVIPKKLVSQWPSTEGALHQKVGRQRTERSSSVVKVNSVRLDSVFELVGELVVIKSQIMEDHAANVEGSARVNGLFNLLDKNVRDLYERTLSLRMSVVQPLLLKLEQSARDAALKLNKDIDFVASGHDFELDRIIIDKVSDSLMHIVRNAVDHGLESAQGRINAGKSLSGKISVSVYQSGGGVVFDISDDGRGIDRDLVIKRAFELGILNDSRAAHAMPDQEVYNFLFHPGFSTAKNVSSISGRGVGLDVVRSAIAGFKGHVKISTTPARGTTFSIRLPLTAAISDGLIIRISGERYVVPLDVIAEVLDIDTAEIVEVNEAGSCLNWQGEFLPLIDISDDFGLPAGPR